MAVLIPLRRLLSSPYEISSVAVKIIISPSSFSAFAGPSKVEYPSFAKTVQQTSSTMHRITSTDETRIFFLTDITPFQNQKAVPQKNN